MISFRAKTADLYNKADLKIDIADTGLKTASYDMIICNHVLEHVDDYHKGLDELHRSIYPDGRIKPLVGPADYDPNVLWRLGKA